MPVLAKMIEPRQTTVPVSTHGKRAHEVQSIAFLVVAVIAYTSERLEGDYGNVSASTSAAFEIDRVGFP